MAGRPLSQDVAVLAVVDALPHPAALLGPDGVPVFINAAERAFLGSPTTTRLPSTLGLPP